MSPLHALTAPGHNIGFTCVRVRVRVGGNTMSDAHSFHALQARKSTSL